MNTFDRLRDYSTTPASGHQDLLNSDTEYHRFNREDARRKLIFRAWIVGLVVVCGVVLTILIQQG